MTRKRKRGTYRSQMPTDPARRAQIIVLDELAKMPPAWNDAYVTKIEADRAARATRSAQHDGVRDIISQGDKQPKTWDEINSTTGTGGISQLYK